MPMSNSHCAALTLVLAHCLCLPGFAAGVKATGPEGQQESGTIEGRVTFVGTPPPSPIPTEDGELQPTLDVNPSGGLRYAVVYLPDAPRSSEPVSSPVTLNQRGLRFVPQVLAVRAGQTVRFTNDDPTFHNVRAQDVTPQNTFSISTDAGTATPRVHRFAAMPAGRPLQLSCDIHPWMAAWVYVFEHDRFAVTSADGSFRIEHVPPGRHRIAVRQPSGRLARDVVVDVRRGKPTRVDVQLTATNIAPGAP